MKYSRQRELILKTLKENCIHPTAEQLYELIRREEPTVSLATVYRNLNLLAENGMVKKIEGLDGTAHLITRPLTITILSAQNAIGCLTSPVTLRPTWLKTSKAGPGSG